MSEWAQKVSTAEMEQGEFSYRNRYYAERIVEFYSADDGSLWTTIIPPALVNFIQIEERAKDVAPDGLSQAAYDQYHQNLQQLLATVPAPPTVPRHLKDPILNTSPKDLEGTVGGTAGDDNSILPVPNHVVLNHLTAAAIRNGTLAVGTTTRYKRKVSTRSWSRRVMASTPSNNGHLPAFAVHLDTAVQACRRSLDAILSRTKHLSLHASCAPIHYLSLPLSIYLPDDSSIQHFESFHQPKPSTSLFGARLHGQEHIART
jgi:hypothetical protein